MEFEQSQAVFLHVSSHQFLRSQQHGPSEDYWSTRSIYLVDFLQLLMIQLCFDLTFALFWCPFPLSFPGFSGFSIIFGPFMLLYLFNDICVVLWLSFLSCAVLALFKTALALFLPSMRVMWNPFLPRSFFSFKCYFSCMFFIFPGVYLTCSLLFFRSCLKLFNASGFFSFFMLYLGLCFILFSFTAGNFIPRWTIQR